MAALAPVLAAYGALAVIEALRDAADRGADALRESGEGQAADVAKIGRVRDRLTEALRALGA